MLRYLIAALLLASILTTDASRSNANFLLSPAIPNTAFQGQYYEVRFRVRGLESPNFTYKNLPSFLNGTSEGVVSGMASSVGSFKVSVTYTSGSSQGSSDVVFRVIASSSSGLSVAQDRAATNLIIQTLYNGNYVFRTSQTIEVQLSAAQGSAPFTWNYNNLPSGLKGDSNGRISGAINQAGYYTFSASCSDAVGNNAEDYFTFNVQPLTSLTTAALIEVPNRNVPLIYNASQVLSQQLAANDAVYAALKAVSQRNSSASTAKASFAKTQLFLNKAVADEKQAQSNLIITSIARDNALASFNQASLALTDAQNLVALANSNLKNANASVASAQQKLDAAQAAFDAAQKALAAATASFNSANIALATAQAAVQAAQAAKADALNAYNLAFKLVQDAKKALVAAQQALDIDNQAVTDAHNAVGLATQANDDAQTGFNVADAEYKAAIHNVKDSNAEAVHLSDQTLAAKSDLGVAQFNLQQALNQLYVAQAAKEAADKATAIAQAQGVTSLSIQTTGSSTFIFAGCTAGAYPTVSGTARVVSKASMGSYMISSGHTLVSGDCTVKAPFSVGDTITYSGYFVDGVVNGQTISKI